MKQNKTAREILAQIENDFFSGTDLEAGSLLKSDERRAFRLSQVERLLTEKHGYAPLAVLLSDMFWTADEGRKEYTNKRTVPLLDKTNRPSLYKE